MLSEIELNAYEKYTFINRRLLLTFIIYLTGFPNVRNRNQN